MRRTCIGNDPACPCQDGDMCHYKGPNPMERKMEQVSNKCDCEKCNSDGPGCGVNSDPAKCHGCLDGIRRVFREELNEWWHFPEGLGAYRCVRIVGCPEHGTNCRAGIEIEKLQALGVPLKSVFHFADCPCFDDSVEHDEVCRNCTCVATIEMEMRADLRVYGTQSQWLQAEAGRLWSYAVKERRENYRLREEIAHYKFALVEGKQ